RTLAMIGMINLPTDGPMEFYASRVAKNTDPTSRVPTLPRPTNLSVLTDLPAAPSAVMPSPSPMTRELQFSLALFSQKPSKPKHEYCKDGRKCKDGQPVNAHNPSKLWEELLMRKMVANLLEEIASPVEHLETIEETFEKTNLLNRQISRSEPNLCSDEKQSTFCSSCSSAIDEGSQSVIKQNRSSSDLGPNRNYEDEHLKSSRNIYLDGL
ncbi:hypothetical protein PMAYCL1PPCAC_04957, partial [Pristionchus mayeri]